jgi:hypothetical protein
MCRPLQPDFELVYSSVYVVCYGYDCAVCSEPSDLRLFIYLITVYLTMLSVVQNI